MPKFYAWDLIKDQLVASPDDIAVADSRPADVIRNTTHVNGGQPFTTWAQVQAANAVSIYGGEGHSNSPGTWNALNDGETGWKVRAVVAAAGGNQLHGYFSDEDGDLVETGLVVARAWSTVGPVPDDATMHPDYGYQARHAELQHQTDGEFEITFSTNGGWVGSDLKGGFRMWPLIGGGGPQGTEMVGDWGAFGGTGYQYFRFLWMPTVKGGNGGTVPPPAGELFLSIWEDDVRNRVIRGVDPSEPNPSTEWIGIEDDKGLVRKI